MLKIASWNINSIRKRIDQLYKFIIDNQIDIVLLQEIKCTEEQFPYLEIQKYEHAIYGQTAKNGVCILSRYPILEKFRVNLVASHHDARYIECVIKYDNYNIRIGSVYVPNGNNAFEYKLMFLDKLIARMDKLLKNEEIIVIAGDYNVAPDDIDTFDPHMLQDQVCFHINEREKLRTMFNLGFTDAFRISNPELQQFSWWNYQGNFLRNNQGMRIDHILLSPQAVDKLEACYIYEKLRKLDNPSDHAPVICCLSDA
jgi:exodeoxyribonuclease III